MEWLKDVLQWVNDNYSLLIVIIALIISIYKKTKNFFSKSKEEQVSLIKNEINTHIVNKPNLRVFEKIKQFALLNESFSVENGMMSMTQKIKRNKVFEKYENVIGKMYK